MLAGGFGIAWSLWDASGLSGDPAVAVRVAGIVIGALILLGSALLQGPARRATPGAGRHVARCVGIAVLGPELPTGRGRGGDCHHRRRCTADTVSTRSHGSRVSSGFTSSSSDGCSGLAFIGSGGNTRRRHRWCGRRHRGRRLRRDQSRCGVDHGGEPLRGGRLDGRGSAVHSPRLTHSHGALSDSSHSTNVSPDVEA